MITITIGSSQNVVSVPSTAREFQPVSRVVNLPSGMNQVNTSIGVVVGASVQSVTLSTRPVALEKALKTQRLNQFLEKGFTPPLKSTSSK
jgi:hypothetical protein